MTNAVPVIDLFQYFVGDQQAKAAVASSICPMPASTRSASSRWSVTRGAAGCGWTVRSRPLTPSSRNPPRSRIGFVRHAAPRLVAITPLRPEPRQDFRL